MNIYKTLASSGIAFVILSTAALADGNLCGTVMAKGQPLAGATVSVQSASQVQTLTTGTKGTYCFTGLHSNVHVVKVEKPGYDTVISQGFLPVSENTLHLNFITQHGNSTFTRIVQMGKPHTGADLTADVYIVH